jgi:hypothetical protein
MTHSAQGMLLITAMYASGVVGLFGITLFPIRAFSLFQKNASLWSVSNGGKLLFSSMLLVSMFLLWGCVDLTFGVSRCLLGYHCGANMASGWLKLSSIGVWYGSFELLSLLFRFLSRKLSSVAT